MLRDRIPIERHWGPLFVDNKPAIAFQTPKAKYRSGDRLRLRGKRMKGRAVEWGDVLEVYSDGFCAIKFDVDSEASLVHEECLYVEEEPVWLFPLLLFVALAPSGLWLWHYWIEGDWHWYSAIPTALGIFILILTIEVAASNRWTTGEAKITKTRKIEEQQAQSSSGHAQASTAQVQRTAETQPAACSPGTELLLTAIKGQSRSLYILEKDPQYLEAISLLATEGDDGSRSVARLISAMAGDRCNEILFALTAAQHLAPTEELIETLRAVLKAPAVVQRARRNFFEPDIASDSQMGWDDRTLHFVRLKSEHALTTLTGPKDSSAPSPQGT